MRHLSRPSLPENEKRRYIQDLLEKSKRRNYKECLVSCKAAQSEHVKKIVKGHLVPRSWLEKISTDDHVYVFATHSVNLYHEQGSEIPKYEHINNALVRYFTCKDHEEFFFCADNAVADLSDLKIPNRMAYKAIIGQLWLERLLQRGYREISASSPQDEVLKRQVHLHSQNVIGLSYYKKEIERCLSPEQCGRCRGRSCRVVGHKVIRMRGEPTVSVSQFCQGSRTRIRYAERQVENIANWGVTVLPNDKGHVAIFHYFLEEEDIVGPTFEYISGLNGRKREAAVSELILKSFENIAISPNMWDHIGKRKEAIRSAFYDNMPDIGFGSEEQLLKWEKERLHPARFERVPNPNQINLFRRTMK